MEPANLVVCRARKKPHQHNALRTGFFLCFVYLLFSTCDAGSKFHRPPASVIARRAGASQYAEMFDDGDVRASRHGIHKRLVGSHEELDYESYQGVLGRPGLDFPVLTGIPNTNFNCRDVGNGYFADLATDCQVFHICDGGRKISFLCPNGTIFRQNDLICDWWFKVNCALSPSLYAESAEILSRSQSQAAAKSKLNHLHQQENSNLLRRSSRLQIPLPIEPATVSLSSAALTRNNETVDGSQVVEKEEGSNIKVSQVPTVTGRKSFQETTARSRTGGTKLRSRQYASFEYSSQQDGSAENFDFEEFLVPRRRPSYRARVPVRIVHPDFIDGRHIYSLNYRAAPIAFRVDSDKESQEFAETASFLKTRNTFSGYDYKQPIGPNRIKFDKVKTVERTRDDKAIESFDQFPTTAAPVTTTQQVNRGTVVFAMSTTTPASFDDGKYTTQAPIDVRSNSGKYTTARRLDTPRTTPFYTPTIPTIASRFESSPKPIYAQSAEKESMSTVTQTTPSTTTSTTPISLEKNPINVSEHAIEMMKTLQELEMVSSSVATGTSTDSELGSRLGLNIPPSSGPDTLHSLAVYIANAMEGNASKSAENNQTSSQTETQVETSSLEDDNKKLISANLRHKTVEDYEKLFQTSVTEPSSTAASNSEILTRFAPIPEQEKNDLDLQQSRNPIYAAASQPQIRELAQLFTHALSAYLHDPDGFRKILADIRPKDPSSGEVEILSNRIGRKNNFEAVSTAKPAVTTDRLELLDFSDVTLKNRIAATIGTNELLSSTTETSPATTTFLPIIQVAANKNNLSPDVQKTPASDLISDNSLGNVGPYYESDADVMASTTTTSPPQTTTEPEENNDLALEINGGLSSMSTTFPYLEDEEGGESDEPIGNGLDTLSRLEDGSPKTTQTPDVNPTTIFSLEAQSSGNFFRKNQPVTLSTLLTPPSQRTPTTEILPPRYTTEESSEQLHSAQSQNFVTGKQNHFSDDEKPSRKGKLVEPTTVSYEFIPRSTTEAPRYEIVNTTTTPGSPRGHYITKSIPSSLLTTTTESPTTTESGATVTYPDTGKISPNPWSSVSYTVFLDPLTINDGLMDEKETTASSYSRTTSQPLDVSTESSSTRFGLRASLVDENTTIRDIDIPTTTEGMKRRANEMFGGLNETAVGHLMNVMKKADSNQKVRRLILLLIQTCDEDYDKTVEDSRKALLDALIGMDNNEIDETKVQIINGRNGRKINLNSVKNAVVNPQHSSTTQDVPITTYRGNQKLIAVPSVETELTPPPRPKTTTTSTETPTTTSTTTTTTSTTTRTPSTTTNPTTYFTGTSTTQIPRAIIKGRSGGGRRVVVNDEALSAETLSTFAEFGKRTTPLGSLQISTTLQPPTYPTEIPEAQPTTFYPVFSRIGERIQLETTFQPNVYETTFPPTTTTSTTTTTTTTPRPTTTTTTRRTTTTTPIPRPTTTRVPRRNSTKVPVTTTTSTSTPAPTTPRGRVGKSVESFLGDASQQTYHSDERAVELLKSLYALASKWGRR